MKLFRSFKTPSVEFLCYKEDWDVIPKPYPARKLMPEWFKELPPKINNENKLENSTIKRCSPFLDALCIGWIIPLAADVEIVSNGDASGITWKTNFYREMVQAHSAAQVKNNPESPKPPLKFLNWWQMKVTPGYSVMFIPPLNRPDYRFECITGLVDAGYNEFINFPFFFKQTSYTGIIKQGTPLVQAIIIKKEEFKTNIRQFTKKDEDDLELTRRQRKAHESVYRDRIWRPMK